MKATKKNWHMVLQTKFIVNHRAPTSKGENDNYFKKKKCSMSNVLALKIYQLVHTKVLPSTLHQLWLQE